MDIKQLNKTELQIMKYIWNLDTAFMKDIVKQFPEPKPAYTTISTLLNRMYGKKYIGFTRLGRDKQYYPILQKNVYFSFQVKSMVSDFFNNSTSQFASFFAENADFSIEQLEELQELFGEQISQKKENK